MEENEIIKVKTTRGILEYYLDWDCDGYIRMINPQTIKKYQELQDDKVDSKQYAVFFAFSNKQFDEGVNDLKARGLMTEGEKIYSTSYSGLLGTKKGLDEYFAAISNHKSKIDELIRQNCDPQEVYFYEHCNYECCIDWDGDKNAIDIVKGIWGKDIVSKIKRYNIC